MSVCASQISVKTFDGLSIVREKDNAAHFV